MKTLAEFIKTTLIGGVLIVLPVYISVLLLAKAVQGILTFIKPITAGMPASLEDFATVLAILLLALLCFLAGLVIRTGPGLRAKNAFEGAVLEKLPGYRVLRDFTGHLTGRGEGQSFTPALVEIEEALVPALIIEELPDGSYTVLVPSAPTPFAGSIYVLPPERVHPVDMPLPTALRVFTRWGAGTGAFLQAMRPSGASATADAR